MTATDPRIERVRAAHAAVLAATAAEEVAIRDAATAGASPSAIARDGLGTLNRGRVYAILGRGPDGEAPNPPARTPIVYLRGAGASADLWERVTTAMWARGWATERDRTAAWHAARASVPVVLVDFSNDLDESEPAPGGGVYFGYHRYAVVGRLKAVYGEPDEDEDLSLVLRRVNGGRISLADMGNRVDEQVLALRVAAALA